MNLRAALEITRPGNCLLAALGALTGILLAFPTQVPDIYALVGAPLAVALVAAQGNIRNDLADIQIDLISHRSRPLPSGRLKASEAGALALLMVALAIPVAWVAAGSIGVVLLLFNIAVLGWYERALKARGLAGNIAIAYLVASTFLFGRIAAGSGAAELQVWIAVAFAMAFLLNLARELLKDVQDIEGDRGHRKTLPLRIGAAATTWLAFGLVLCAVATTALLWVERLSALVALLSWAGTLLVLLADAIALTGAFLSLRSAARGQLALKFAMGVATLGFLVVGLYASSWMLGKS